MKNDIIQAGKLAKRLAIKLKKLVEQAALSTTGEVAFKFAMQYLKDTQKYLASKEKYDLLANLFSIASKRPVLQASIGAASCTEWMFRFSLFLYPRLTFNGAVSTDDVPKWLRLWNDLFSEALTPGPIMIGKKGWVLPSHCFKKGKPILLQVRMSQLEWIDKAIELIDQEISQVPALLFNKGNSIDPSKSVSIFISYSHQDTKEKEQFIRHLTPLMIQGLISAWHDSKIKPGDTIKHSIDDNLTKANYFIALISSNYMASRYCMDVELQQAIKQAKLQKTVIIPIIIKECHWKSTYFGDLKALPSDGKPVNDRKAWSTKDQGFTNAVIELQSVIEKGNSEG